MSQKKRGRWLRIAGWTVGVLVVLMVTAFFALDYAIDRVLRSMSGLDTASLLEELDKEPRVEAGAADAVDKPDASVGDGKAASKAKDGSDADQASTNADEAGADVSGQDKPGSEGAGQSGRDDGYTAEVSLDKAKAIEEEITLKEKTKVTSVLLKSLSPSDMNALRKLASGGLSVAEKREARDLLLERLSEEEYNELIAIAAKYGVSQGRTYREVKKE